MDIDLIIRVLENYCKHYGREDKRLRGQCEAEVALNECHFFKKQMESYYEQQGADAEKRTGLVNAIAKESYNDGYTVGVYENKVFTL